MLQITNFWYNIKISKYREIFCLKKGFFFSTSGPYLQKTVVCLHAVEFSCGSNSILKYLSVYIVLLDLKRVSIIPRKTEAISSLASIKMFSFTKYNFIWMFSKTWRCLVWVKTNAVLNLTSYLFFIQFNVTLSALVCLSFRQ